MILNSPTISGSLTVTGNIITSGSITISGSIASASYATNAELLDGLDSTAFATTGAYSATSASLYATSASLSATSGSLSATSGSLSATSGSLSATSGSLSTASGSFNTRVTALEVTGSALSSSLLTVSGSGYATSGSLSTASGSFDSRVATIESKYATTGSNTFTSTQVVSGSILQSGSFTTTGTIIAQTINVQTVTSSVVYSSGSNVFGNSIGNSQTFTGSVLITGSLTIAGGSSATSYSGTTIYGSTVACSPIGCFATSCATSFIGGTMSGTTIYGSTVVCSANGLLIGNGGVTATCNYLPKFTGTSTIGNSIIQEASSNIGIGISPTNKLDVYGTSGTIAQIKDGSTYAGIVIDAHSSSTPFSRYSSSGTGKFELGYYNSKFYFNNNVGVNDTNAAMLITSTGNLGLGVTPSAWNTFKAIEIGGLGNGIAGVSNQVVVFSNAYWNSGYKYASTGAATNYDQVTGQHRWFNAPSGAAAGDAITFTQAMTLNASGNLSIGNTNDTYKLDVSKDQNASTIASISNATSGTAAYAAYRIGSSANVWLYNFSNAYTTSGRFAAGTFLIDVGTTNGININTTNGSLTLSTDNTTRLTIGSTGATTLNGCPLGHLLYIQNSNSGYYSSTDYLDNAGTEKLIVGYANASTGNALASKAIIYGVSGVGLNFYTNGCTTAKMVIDTTGNVGIGVTPSAGWTNGIGLEVGFVGSAIWGRYVNEAHFTNNFYYSTSAGCRVYASTNPASDYEQYDGNHTWYTAPSGTAGQGVSLTSRMTILQAGNVGIGTSSPLNKLDIVQVGSNNAVAGVGLKIVSDAGNPASIALSQTGRGTVTIGMAAAGAAPADFVLGTDVTGNIIFKQGLTGTHGTDLTTGTERMRITLGGVTLFGGTTFTTITSAVLGATNPAFTGRNWSFGPNSSGDYVVYHNQGGGNTGVYLTYGGSSWTSNSDENIKDIIEIIPNALESIKDLRAVKFYWKGDESKKENLGLIAQDVQKVYPELIDKQVNDNDEVLGVRYTELIPVLVKAIQELKAENDIFKTCLGIS